MSTFIEVGDWVRLSHDTHSEGIVLYIGKVSGYKEEQYGIEVTDFSVGDHNGKYKGTIYFETKDTTANRGIFVGKSVIRKMKKADFQNTARLAERKKRISSFQRKTCIHLDPITALDTLDIIRLLGKYWLRYVTLLLPTLDKFVIPRVCTTFHHFVTLEKGSEDTPDPPPFTDEMYRTFASMQLVVDDVATDTDHSRLSTSITEDIANAGAVRSPSASPHPGSLVAHGNRSTVVIKELNIAPAAEEDTKTKSKVSKSKKESSKGKKHKSKTKGKGKGKGKAKEKSQTKQKEPNIAEEEKDAFVANPTFEFKQRGLNEEEQFLWNELCKTEAMVQYIEKGIDQVYEGRMNISDKVVETVRQMHSQTGAETEREMIYTKDGVGSIRSTTCTTGSKPIASVSVLNVLWYLSCPLGEEHQALDHETRTLIQNADEPLFYEYIANEDNNLYREKNGKINLYNKRFLKRTPFERNVISYFLTFQNKLVEIYHNSASPFSKVNDYYSDEKDDFYLIVSNLLILDISMNEDIPPRTLISAPNMNEREEETTSPEFQDKLSPLPNMRSSLGGPMSPVIFPKTNLVVDGDSFYCRSFGGNSIGIPFLSSILKSEYSSLISLQLTRCGLDDNDVNTMCTHWRQRETHSPLEILSLAENPNITDAYMDELFAVIANYLGNVMCLMLYETGISDETCSTIFNFYKSQFSKSEMKNDKISKEIYEKYHSIDVFKKELAKLRDTQQITHWKHKNEAVAQFMYNIANDYGEVHKHYAETTGNNPNDARWEQLYQEILRANNVALSTEAVIELFERKIQMEELDKERELYETPHRKKRSKLKQIRLHLNDGITRGGFAMLNDCYKKKYIKDPSSVILIDGFVDDNSLTKITQYKQWRAQCFADEEGLRHLKINKKEIDNRIQLISNKLMTQNLSNERIAAWSAERKKLNKEKEQLVYRGLELNDRIAEAKQNPMKDPKRDPKWDKRLMTNWSNVWSKWMDVMAYKNLI